MMRTTIRVLVVILIILLTHIIIVRVVLLLKLLLKPILRLVSFPSHKRRGERLTQQECSRRRKGSNAMAFFSKSWAWVLPSFCKEGKTKDKAKASRVDYLSRETFSFWTLLTLEIKGNQNKQRENRKESTVVDITANQRWVGGENDKLDFYASILEWNS
jgi:hypothetical protein